MARQWERVDEDTTVEPQFGQNPPPSFSAPTGVVVTTEQDAQWRGFWEDVDTRWKAQQQGFVAKEEHVSPQT